jgi:hypothetical protein
MKKVLLEFCFEIVFAQPFQQEPFPSGFGKLNNRLNPIPV